MNTFLESLGLVVEVFAFASLLAMIVERLTEHFLKPPLKSAGADAAVPYVALALGILASVAFNIDLLTPVAVSVGLEPLSQWPGLILSGLLVGGGSNFVSDIWPGQKPPALG